MPQTARQSAICGKGSKLFRKHQGARWKMKDKLNNGQTDSKKSGYLRPQFLKNDSQQ